MIPPRETPAAIARVGLKKLLVKDCHDQRQSPLFTVLSPEVRNTIFVFVLQAEWHEPTEAATVEGLKKNIPYVHESVPHSHCRIDTALLRACRRIYLEAEFIPIHSKIHRFYLKHWGPNRVIAPHGWCNISLSHKKIIEF